MVDLASFDPFDAAFLQDPHPWYAAMRDRAPVCRAGNLWFVTSRALVAEALGRPEVFSSRFGSAQTKASGPVVEELRRIEEQGWPQVSTMLTEDPPVHDRYRRLVSRAFTYRRVQGWAPDVREICRSLVTALTAKAEIEYVADFAVVLPLRVIARVLGVPEDLLDDFKRWSDDWTVTIGAEVGDERRLEAARGVLEFQRYFAAELDARRAEPRDDLLTGLTRAHLAGEEDDPLTTAECLSILSQLLVAGNETTTKLLTGLAHLLAADPARWRDLRQDPGRATALTEEGLRLLSPVQGMYRLVMSDTRLGETDLPAGATVVLAYASANRDEAVYEDAARFSCERRNVRDHLAFGWGVHYCLGAPLARLETTTALREMARGWASMALTEANDLAYEPSFLLRGLRRLHLAVTP
ncbi:cytochrome P450 [Nonomuraea sp. NPDC050643]|uniref:cytochrome P450 n=1 Tax=Nonomuraea sp. NPDC050643 TaxID=3155660 RepID=UPI0033D108BB